MLKLLQKMASEISLKMSEKSTLGIIGMSPGHVALLNYYVTQEVNRQRRIIDQDHPEVLALGLPTSDLKMLKSAADLCRDFGCDIIAIAESVPEATLQASFGYLSLPIFAVTQYTDDLRTLAVTLVDEMYKPRKTLRPCTYFISQEETNEALKRDCSDRSARMKQTYRRGGYPLLDKMYSKRFVGVLGGAGPLASAAFCQKCADFGVPFVLYSNTNAPSKHDFEMGVGPDYRGHYQNACDFFSKINPAAFVITCNTAHKRLGSYLDGFRRLQTVFVDIRGPALEDSVAQHGNKFILLGTNRTTGVGLGNGEIGIFEEFRVFHHLDIELFVCNPEQQDTVNSAIRDVKAGRLRNETAFPQLQEETSEAPIVGGNNSEMTDLAGLAVHSSAEVKIGAREKILKVVDELRALYGHKPVILACTELPLPFSMMELSHLGFIDPGQCLCEKVREMLFDTSNA